MSIVQTAALLQVAAVGEGYDIKTLQQADGPILTTALHTLVAPVRDAEEKYVSLLHFVIMHGEGALQLTPEVTYKVRDDTLICEQSSTAEPPALPPQPFQPGCFRLPGGYFMEFQAIKYEEFLKNAPIFKKDLNCCADYAKIQGSILLRTRQPGDYYCPPGRHLRKTIKKYYNELGLPPGERALRPMLAEGSEVLWLWGSGFAEGTAPSETTQTVLTVREEKIEEE